MDPLFRFLSEQTDLRTVDILFSHPLDAYNLGYLDVPETFRSIYEADPARAWKREATPGMGNKEKEKEKEGEGFVPGVSLLQLTIGFLLPLVQWIGREEEPVCFPSLERIRFRVKDKVLLEALSGAWSSLGGETPERLGKIVLLESEEGAAAMERFRRIVWVEGM